MRINKYVAACTGLSRRAADAAIEAGRVLVNGQKPGPGDDVADADTVTLDRLAITPAVKTITIMMNKPVGYVVSRNGQGSKTIYDILPPEYHTLKPVGRLDKNSSGLLLLTNDGHLANQLTHPSKQKAKVYEIELDKPLEPLHQQMISDYGVTLDDGRSQFSISKIDPVRSTGGERSEPWEERAGSEQSDADTQGGAGPSSKNKEASPPAYQITMHEGRNRQIRRTFQSLGYDVVKLHRTQFGPYTLNIPATKHFEIINEIDKT
jgi:23S rRNA pseudouridine2605 synthase